MLVSGFPGRGYLSAASPMLVALCTCVSENISRKPPLTNRGPALGHTNNSSRKRVIWVPLPGPPDKGITDNRASKMYLDDFLLLVGD